MHKPLSTLTKLPLREVWNHEAIDFTNWLSQKENLDALSEEVGIELELIQKEATVGKFSVDILAKEANTERKIVIENQFGDTNHDHLGKIITYSSGYDAEVIIWIVENVRDEHQKAVEWLNEHTDENTSFFLIKIELWQIGDSNPAPKFDVIVSPNEWAKTIKTSAGRADLTDTKLQQLEFWNKFKVFVRMEDKNIRLRTPRPQHWYSLSMGTSEAHIALTINSKTNHLSCELYIDRNEELYNYLLDKKGKISRDLGEEPKWIDAKVASAIKVSKKVKDIFNEEMFNNYFEWLLNKTKLFQKVFSKYINLFKKETD